MSQARHRKPSMTLAEFLAWEERQPVRYEFDGFEPVAMTGGTAAHARIQRNLSTALDTRLREEAEAAVAAHVEANVPPERGARREAALRDLLTDYMDRAEAARQVSDEAWAAATAAQERLVALSQQRRDSGLEVLRGRADAQTFEAARLLLEAYVLSVQAAAAASVVAVARRGETWQPRPPFDVNDLSWAQPVRRRRAAPSPGD